jgi:hypothetical protein
MQNISIENTLKITSFETTEKQSKCLKRNACFPYGAREADASEME